MRAVTRTRPADYVRPSLPDARISRMWSVVAEKERARVRPSLARRRTFVMLAAAAVFVSLAVFAKTRWLSAPSGPVAGLQIDTGSASQELSMQDGSLIRLAPATRLRVITAAAGEIRLHLDRGHVTCDVVHREARRFVVEAGGVEVEDRGTTFAIDVQPNEDARLGAAVSVHVDQGEVEVHDATRAVVATLKPGQAWESRTP